MSAPTINVPNSTGTEDFEVFATPLDNTSNDVTIYGIVGASKSGPGNTPISGPSFNFYGGYVVVSKHTIPGTNFVEGHILPFGIHGKGDETFAWAAEFKKLAGE